MSRLLTKTQTYNRYRYICICARICQLEQDRANSFTKTLDEFSQQDLDKLILEKKRLEVIFMLLKEELPK